MSSLPMLQIVIAIAAFFVHLVAISTSYWINLYSRGSSNYLDGHVGIWFVCFRNLFAAGYENYRQEFCDPVDRIFRPSPYSSLSLVLGISVLVTIFLYVPFAIVSRDSEKSPSSPKSSCSRYSGRLKVALAIISFILVALILIFMSIRNQEIMPILNTRNLRTYRSTKGYSFYLETIVALSLIALTIFGIRENRSRYRENVTSF